MIRLNIMRKSCLLNCWPLLMTCSAVFSLRILVHIRTSKLESRPIKLNSTSLHHMLLRNIVNRQLIHFYKHWRCVICPNWISNEIYENESIVCVYITAVFTLQSCLHYNRVYIISVFTLQSCLHYIRVYITVVFTLQSCLHYSRVYITAVFTLQPYLHYSRVYITAVLTFDNLA